MQDRIYLVFQSLSAELAQTCQLKWDQRIGQFSAVSEDS